MYDEFISSIYENYEFEDACDIVEWVESCETKEEIVDCVTSVMESIQARDVAIATGAAGLVSGALSSSARVFDKDISEAKTRLNIVKKRLMTPAIPKSEREALTKEKEKLEKRITKMEKIGRGLNTGSGAARLAANAGVVATAGLSIKDHIADRKDEQRRAEERKQKEINEKEIKAEREKYEKERAMKEKAELRRRYNEEKRQIEQSNKSGREKDSELLFLKAKYNIW